MSPPTEHDRRFVGSLERLRDSEDRAPLAALRRGLGKSPGEAAEMHRHVLPWVPRGASPWPEECHYLVASLFAWHQGSWPAGPPRGPANLGASFARLAGQVESGSVEKRFAALLNCHQEDLPDHLRRAVGLLKAKEVPVDWAQLLSDLRNWGWESRAVQLEWARAFWAGGPAGQETEPAAEAAEAPGA